MRALLLSLAVVTAPAYGCALQKDHEALTARVDAAEKAALKAQSDNVQLKADLDATRARLDNALKANADSSSDVMSSKARMNDLAGKLEENQHGLEEVRKDVAQSRTEIYARIDDLKRTQQQTAAATPPPPPLTVPADKTAHLKALEDAHAKRDWAMVRALAPEYVNRYNTDEKADDALFLAGDADLLDGRPSSALGHFNRLLKLYPKSNVLDRTLYDMGEAYMLMHDCGNAKLAYEACEKRFSKEKIGADARVRLATIAKNTPGLCAPP